jgi:hypothetical protein
VPDVRRGGARDKGGPRWGAASERARGRVGVLLVELPTQAAQAREQEARWRRDLLEKVGGEGS